jgi:hypothetical protein
MCWNYSGVCISSDALDVLGCVQVCSNVFLCVSHLNLPSDSYIHLWMCSGVLGYVQTCMHVFSCVQQCSGVFGWF